MKKYIAILLALLTLLSVSTVTAAGTEEKTGPDASGIARRSFVEKKTIYTDRSGSVMPLSTDTVTIDSDAGLYTVTTAFGTKMSVTVPFGASCITQDIHQQLELYMSLFSDVSGALNHYVKEKIHLDLYDFYTGQSVYIAEIDDTFAALMGDLNKLTVTERRQAADYMSKYWYGGFPAKVKNVGKNAYITFDLAQDCGFVIYHTIVGGRLIEIYTPCTDGKTGSDAIDKMIFSLTFEQTEAKPAAAEAPTEPVVPVTEPTVPAAEPVEADTESTESTQSVEETTETKKD